MSATEWDEATGIGEHIQWTATRTCCSNKCIESSKKLGYRGDQAPSWWALKLWGNLQP